MKRFATILAVLILAVLCSAPAEAQTSPGHFQWTWRGYNTQAEAAAAWAVGGYHIIVTGDALVPFVVFRYEDVDFWCCAPAHFEAQVYASHYAVSVWKAHSLNPTTRKCGLTSNPDGTSIVWRTF